MGCTTSATGGGTCSPAAVVAKDELLSGHTSTAASTARAILSARVGVIAGSTRRSSKPPVRPRGRAHRWQHSVSQETERRVLRNIRVASTFNRAFRFPPETGISSRLARDQRSEVAASPGDRFLHSPICTSARGASCLAPTNKADPKDFGSARVARPVTLYLCRRVATCRRQPPSWTQAGP